MPICLITQEKNTDIDSSKVLENSLFKYFLDQLQMFCIHGLVFFHIASELIYKSQAEQFSE